MYIIFFLGFRSTSIKKLNKNNNKLHFAMCPRQNKVDYMVIFLKMLLIQIHHISDIFKFGWKIYCKFFLNYAFVLQERLFHYVQLKKRSNTPFFETIPTKNLIQFVCYFLIYFYISLLTLTHKTFS